MLSKKFEQNRWTECFIHQLFKLKISSCLCFWKVIFIIKDRDKLRKNNFTLRILVKKKKLFLIWFKLFISFKFKHFFFFYSKYSHVRWNYKFYYNEFELEIWKYYIVLFEWVLNDFYNIYFYIFFAIFGYNFEICGSLDYFII